MTAKIMLILLGLGAVAMGLLAQRQQRIDAAYELTRIHSRCDEIRTSLWDVRCAIAEEISQLRPPVVPEITSENKHVVQHQRADQGGDNGG